MGDLHNQAKHTRKMADELQARFAMADRFRARSGEAGSFKIIADSSIKGVAPAHIIVIDDMFDTCGHLCNVVEALHVYAPEAKIYACATHGYFSRDEAAKIKRLVD